MYSWEIDKFLQDRNFTITTEEMDLIRKSSQIVEVAFCGSNNWKSKYNIHTTDGHDWGVWMLHKEEVD